MGSPTERKKQIDTLLKLAVAYWDTKIYKFNTFSETEVTQVIMIFSAFNWRCLNCNVIFTIISETILSTRNILKNSDLKNKEHGAWGNTWSLWIYLWSSLVSLTANFNFISTSQVATLVSEFLDWHIVVNIWTFEKDNKLGNMNGFRRWKII